ncbi:MAG: stage V sporulation protein D [Ruminococcaceae bacterium]|nr:stage V sporulation protein D [Oscillospiraceae bacterium]
MISFGGIAVRIEQSTFKQKKRIMLLLFLVVVIFFALLVRVAWLQIVRGEWLSSAAREQQTSDNTISPERGLIYDRNMKVLATNLSVETISITPKNVRDNSKQTPEQIAAKLAEILELDKDSVLAKINKQSNFEYIKKKVEKDQADAVRAYIEEYRIDGIRFAEDTKRYYPYGNFASQVIGFAGSDNNGLEGIEMVYDEQLRGVPGRIVSANKTAGLEIPDNYESYYEPQNGKSVVLTIDETIQHFTEKHLENARVENQLEEGAAAIVMNVKTGEILAMATKPDYDLNEPFAVTSAVEEKYPDIQKELESLEGSEYNARLTEVTQFLRRNKAVVDSYEPGSTFKIAVASMALEENVVGLNDHFFCSGAIKVADRTISCANRNGHGAQTFVQGVQNSCNPVFIEVGARVGRNTFMKYVKGFGFREKTGIELPGETDGIFHAAENFKEIDLATSSFGQSFNVTPLQMVTMVSAVANGGKLMKPHIVKQLVDENGNVIEDYKPQVVRQVISEETSETMCKILESVVSEGGGRNAYLAGYRVAGKTGTSEKQPRGNGKYVASFVGFAPADDPEIVCLVILDQPPVGATYYGGLIAAPVVKSILEESLQYLGVEPEYTQEEMEMIDITVPDVTGKTRKEAETILKEEGVNITFRGQGDIVLDQVPKAYSKLARNSKVVAYTEGEESKKTVTIPDVVGCYGSEANKGIVNAGLNVRVKGLSGSGGLAVCTEQQPPAGTVVEPGTIVTLDFRFAEIRD